MTESLRDAIQGVWCIHQGNTILGGDCFAGKKNAVHSECAEAAALKWFADWLRSDEAPSGPCTFATTAECCPYHEGRKVGRERVSALADALTKENPHD